ncbi:MAG: ADP compounds hydrolase NudE [Gammaproteobacteria bacterium]|nr:ADP compounds hydrolase NudE [Gammaproteobacteria bacterium]
MSQKPQILNAKVIAETRIFQVEQLDLKFSNGVEVSYERMRSSGNGAVLIVPLLDTETVLLTREYAAGVHRYELALPKGKIETDEDILLAADREMMEEVGYGAKNLTLISSLTVSPSYMDHITHIVLAEDLYPKKCEGDEPEEIEVMPWRLDQLSELLLHEECTEARSIAALFMVRERLLSR